MISKTSFDSAENYYFYNSRLMGPEPQPSFETPNELEKYWGARWGTANEYGPLKMVLVRPPNSGMEDIRADAWDEQAQALVDPQRNWHYKRDTPPDMDLVLSQHKGLCKTLENEGVKVVYAPDLPRAYTRSVYTRDPVITVPGGAIITRLAQRLRRGEEASITQILASIGMPILGTINGTGLLEGGSFVMLGPKLGVYGMSVRSNSEGLRQLENLVSPMGIELIKVPMPGYTVHIDGQFMIIDEKTALANVHRLPYEFIEKLKYMEYEIIHPHIEEQMACNSLVIEPGRTIMPSIYPRTAEKLSKRGFDVLMVDYEEIIHNGGSIHCSTNELIRDW